jgi:ribosomal protein S12 methylthiotransferase
MSELSAPRTVHVVSLGCPKNQVDTELMVGSLRAAGLELVAAADDADVLLVNTCAFIEASKVESVDAILELAAVKERRPQARLVVAGCLSQRHAPELRAELPEVDAFIGTGEVQRLREVLALPAGGGGHDLASGARKPRPAYLADHLEPRWVAPDTFSTYLKIAEGCSQGCSFCIIPKLRGTQRSRPVQDCVAEARRLVEAGCVELCLVAQDLTHYGEDIGQPDALAALVRALGAVDGLRWVRLLYAYPHNFTPALIAAIAETDNCCKYLDMPLQHCSDRVLQRMNRRTSRAEMESLLTRQRGAMPALVLRTTLLVGHPGEGEEDFAALCDFVERWQFDHMGAFAYSQEEGTASARMPDQQPSLVKRHRLRKLLALQRKIARARNAARVGQTLEVLVHGLSAETDLLLEGRHAGQAPEIDGVVYINDAPDDIGRGQLRRVEICEAHDYDLVGRVI